MKSMKRHQEHEEMDIEGTWAISYGDMVTLLLCFFILFFTVDHKKDYQEKIQQTLFQMFQTQGESVTSNGQSSVNLGAESPPGADPEVVKSLNGVSHQVGNKILIEFPEVSFFNSGRTELTNEGRNALKMFMAKYMPYAGSNTLNIRAFTDERKVLARKDRAYKDNLELSALRAVATMRDLQSLGMPLARMRVGGYGELRLAEALLKENSASIRKPANLDLARKIVLVIEPGGSLDL